MTRITQSEFTATFGLDLIQPLVSVKSNTGEIERGISQYPRLAAQVYAAHPELVAFILANKAVNQQSIDLQLGHLPNNVLTSIHASPEQLFARHCAVLGSTGSEFGILVDKSLPNDLGGVKSKSCCKFTLSNPSQLTN